MGLGGTTIVLVVGMLLTGSINTISKKAGYNTCSVGLPGIEVEPDSSAFPCPEGQRKFDKPWSQTLVMFAGEAMCVLIFCWKRRQNNRHKLSIINEAEPFLDAEMLTASPKTDLDYSPGISSVLVCIIPTICDLGGTTISGIGLLFTTSSLYQMLRGSIIIFTGLFSVIFLKRKLLCYHWLGIFITTLGVTSVGVSSFIGAKDQEANSRQMLGNLLVVLAQLMSASQMVIEEKFLKSRNLPPEFVVATEGTAGVLLMLAIVLPVVNVLPGTDGDGINESAIDAAVLISNSGLLALLVGLYFCSICFYNYFGLSVAKKLSSVHRCLVDACRTVVVWTADILIHVFVGGAYGERWVPVASFVQLGGFVIMVIGTLTYYAVIKWPCLRYPGEDEDEDDLDSGVVSLPPALAPFSDDDDYN